MAEVDRLMIEHFGILLIQMMENAGRGLAEQAARMLGGRPAGKAVLVLCGAGNNGGGGMAAARHLHNRGAAVQVKLAADPERLKEIPAQQWGILERLGLEAPADPDLTGADLILDALIGYGLRGDPRGEAAEWIERLTGAGRPILALDTPSGLDATTGRPGSPCIRAAATLTLALPKEGLRASNAERYVGELYLADIGVPPSLYGGPGLRLEVGPIFSTSDILRLR